MRRKVAMCKLSQTSEMAKTDTSSFSLYLKQIFATTEANLRLCFCRTTLLKFMQKQLSKNFVRRNDGWLAEYLRFGLSKYANDTVFTGNKKVKPNDVFEAEVPLSFNTELKTVGMAVKRTVSSFG